MSVYAVSWAKRQRTGDAVLKHVLIALADYADEDGFCWPSQTRIAFDTELNDRTIRRALQKLEHKGFLDRQKRERRPDGSRQTDMIRLAMQHPVTKSGSDLPTGLTVQTYRSQSPVNHHRTTTYPNPRQGTYLSGLGTALPDRPRPALATVNGSIFPDGEDEL